MACHTPPLEKPKKTRGDAIPNHGPIPFINGMELRLSNGRFPFCLWF